MIKHVHHKHPVLETIGTIPIVIMFWVLLFVCAMLCGCSTKLLKHELEYQGTKLVLDTLNDPYGQQAMYNFLEKYEETEDFKQHIRDIATADRDIWLDNKIGQAVTGGGLFGGGGLIAALAYFLKKKSATGTLLKSKGG